MAFGDSARAAPVIPVSDRAQAVEFYGGTLGFAVHREDDDGIEFRAGEGSRFYVYESVGAGQSRHTLASFAVADLEQAMDELRGKGVTFEEYDLPDLKTENGIATVGDVRGAWFKDPDGNIIALEEELRE